MIKRACITNSRLAVCFLIFMMLFIAVSCEKKAIKDGKEGKKLVVVTSLFPIYDFAREITKDKAKITMLLPPGIEPHSFDPRPADIITLNNADIFIYTNKYMEPWTDDIIKGITSQTLVIIDSSLGVNFMKKENGHSHDKKHKHIHADPHIWLDFSNAMIMVDNILDGLVRKDPDNADFYRTNAGQYKKRLIELDAKYKESLALCQKKIFVSGGHFSFNYLAGRYGLKYISAFEGFSPDAEPTPRQLAKIINTMKQYGLRHIFYEELITPRIAETIKGETGASLLMLHAAHNISKNEFASGETFISLMEKNLESLKTGLQCR